ncbi:MAG: uracil-DNA glycosylase [Deltaproteobacteria bacterium]|nr:uracil-DNA glycosylase [Deltaproteobacteria bacterium]
MTSIEKFINLLSQQKNSSVLFNPYLNPNLANNLNLYLDLMIKIQVKRVLLVGEAPGYKGCKHTGIPFTSGGVFQEIKHPLLKQLKKKLVLEQIESENTASIVWRHLSNYNITPLFWNAFPFHPHPKNSPNQNRAPNQTEIKKSVNYLIQLQKIFRAEVIAGVGRNGTKAAQLAFPDLIIEYIRHPSHGGKTEFISGISKILDT